MMSPANHATFIAAPTVADVKKIGSLNDPVLRNLQITQCYYELSSAFAQRTGPEANWCTFATWASKQAGQTIRKHDLARTLEAILIKDEATEKALSLVVLLAKQFGAGQSLQQLREKGIAVLLRDTASRASDAVSRGNKKVFDEIAFEFARFIAGCLQDVTYRKENIERFSSGLKPGDPPAGQELLLRAFNNYYQAFFETDKKRRTELYFLANLQIGFHEQNRLQPEIAEALNAAIADTTRLRDRLLAIIFKEDSFLLRMRMFFQRFFGRTALLDNAVEDLVLQVQKTLRSVLTLHLMTLAMPPDNRLRLGKNLLLDYHQDLQKLSHTPLLEWLSDVDPTPDSLEETAATDWANLRERMHFIADLFRCYQLKKEVFNEVFTNEQVKTIKEGRLPGGRL